MTVISLNYLLDYLSFELVKLCYAKSVLTDMTKTFQTKLNSTVNTQRRKTWIHVAKTVAKEKWICMKKKMVKDWICSRKIDISNLFRHLPTLYWNTYAHTLHYYASNASCRMCYGYGSGAEYFPRCLKWIRVVASAHPTHSASHFGCNRSADAGVVVVVVVVVVFSNGWLRIVMRGMSA